MQESFTFNSIKSTYGIKAIKKFSDGNDAVVFGGLVFNVLMNVNLKSGDTILVLEHKRERFYFWGGDSLPLFCFDSSR